ncbi:Hypothetical predicted protein [Mytilus galloprovincialis]|uniref:Integrase zinc-binding domain-containing protein n=1 Tax=Mytilus galloprovincialis TaxID=29158 RepID=A0A8B6E1I9_MYTGA|nr:Hypothetical predicted protein [Mytilus galloprovincialis]
MHGAGRDMRMTCRITNPTEFSIELLSFKETLHVAPIDCDMLIGADFLIKHGAILDVPAKKMNLRNTQVHLKLGGETTTTNSPIVNRVTVQHTVIVPPNSALRIDLESADMATDYLIEPKGNTTLLVPRTVCAKGQKPSLCFLNITDNPVKIPKGDEVGYTQEVRVIQSMDEEPVPSVGTCTTPSTLEKGSPKSGIPSHLKDLYEDSCSVLSTSQKSQLRQLLIKYKDVFAKEDFDLGSFSAIEHTIDTGEAKPIQHRMRRTPACFVDEEEAHLQKMLDAGVIQPSMSEWASAPVLISAGQQHLQPVSGWAVPTCTKDVERFLGFVNYHRSFIKDYAKISAPLYEVTGKKPFFWTHQRQLAFDTLKHKLTVAPVLALPNNTDRFILDTDASQNAIGAELIQVQNGRERTIAYDIDEVIPLVKPRKRQKQFKNVSSAMLQLFGTTSETLATPQAIETTESQTVPDSPNVDCNLDLTASAPILDQLKEDDTWFSTHIDLICLPTTAHIVIHDDTACHVASISQSEGISFKGFTNEEIKTKQSEDPDLLLLLNWLKDQVEPSQNTLFSASPAVKSYWINKEKFFLDDNGILKSYPKDEGASVRLVIPSSLKDTVMELCHELPSAGHQGMVRTMAKVKTRYQWYRMTSDIKAFVATCSVCNKNKKPNRYGRCPMINYHAGSPMERVHLDFMGPLPKTKNGHENILMLVDQFYKMDRVHSFAFANS